MIGVASTSAQAVDLARRARPDLVVLGMPIPELLQLARAIRRSTPSSRCLALGVVDEEHHILACVEAGCQSYVGRDASLEAIRQAIEELARGELHCAPRIAGSFVRRLAALSGDVAIDGDQNRLTHREREIVELIERGRSNKEIARELSIEVATVKNHVHHILAKLQVRRRTEAVACLRFGPLQRAE